MTVYTTSFGEYTTGAAPSDWTARWTTTGETWAVRADAATTAGKYLEHTRTTTAKRLLSWDDIDGDSGRDNGEIFVRYRSTSATSADQFYLVLRGSGSAGSETAYLFYNTSGTNVRIAKMSSGTITEIANFTFTLINNTWLGLRFRANGTALKAKIWNSQLDAEPAAWSIETTDATITGTGWIGVGNFATTGTRSFDDVAIGTSGDTAAFPPSAEVRETQDVMLALGVGSPTTRATQLAALVIGGVSPVIRETQFAALPLVEFHADTPITQMTALVLADLVPCTTRWAQTWTITRTDGQVFAFTSLDRPLTFRGVVHTPCNSLTATATEQSTTIGASGNMELLGIISDVGISEQELYNGLFDFARFEIWMVPWNNSGGETPFRLMAGTTGTMSHGIDGFKFEVLTGSANLRQKALLEVFSASCRYGFGSTLDARCPVNLAAITVAGAATSTAVPAASNASTRRIVIDSSRAEAAGHFDLGVITFTGGANAGAKSEIKRFEGGVFVLWSPLLFPIEIGDTYTATPGCNKSPADHMRFNADMVDYGGFPDVPGSDSINQFPDAKG
jgi:uncharacterized phage protein (TIGR02218 family)